MAQRHPTALKIKQPQITNPVKGEKSDFQSYRLIRFKCSVFSKKSQGIQRYKKVCLFQKKKSTETVPEKNLLADLLDLLDTK